MSIAAKSNADRTKLTIVIVHFNTVVLTVTCVRSLLAVLENSPLADQFAVVIVDNRSESAEFDRLCTDLDSLARPEVILARNCMNSGFGLGCMLGLNYSAGDFVAFVNSDTQFDEDAFSPLIDYLEAHQDVGVIAPQHRGVDGAPERSFSRFDSIPYRLLGRRLSEIVGFDRGADPRKTYDEPVIVDFVFGSFMLFRREALAVTGGFDPNIFLFYEEMDLCYRLRQRGYKCVFFPGVGFRHVGQASFKQKDIIKLESDLSLLYLLRKNRGYFYFLCFYLIKVISYLIKSFSSKKHRYLLSHLISLGPPQASSLRTKQMCNFDYVNRI